MSEGIADVIISDSVWLSLSAASSLIAMSWLALAMKTHWQQVFGKGRTLPNTPVLRLSASLMLVGSLICALKADHPAMASLVWVMLVTAAAVIVAWMLARIPVVFRCLWPERLGGKSSS